MSTPISLSALNALAVEDFVSLLGGVFEHSPWVAQRVAGRRPFASVEALHAAMVAEIEAAGRIAQLRLIRAHPELAGKAAVRGHTRQSIIALFAQRLENSPEAEIRECLQQIYRIGMLRLADLVA